jgi:hypothetical protein
MFASLVGGERCRQHDTSVVDQHIGSAQFMLDAGGGCNDGRTFGYVSLERYGSMA